MAWDVVEGITIHEHVISVRDLYTLEKGGKQGITRAIHGQFTDDAGPEVTSTELVLFQDIEHVIQKGRRCMWWEKTGKR